MLAAALRAARAPVVAPKTWTRPMSTTEFLGVEDILSSLPSDGPPKGGAKGYGAPRRNQWSGFGKTEKVAVPETRLRLHCHSTPNNTIATLTDKDGSTIAWFSGGSCGFKKGNRATYEAGYQCAVRTFRKIEEMARKDGNLKVDLFLKGFGQGREALKGALLATEGEGIRPLITSITDRTAIKIGGTRAKKMPRN